VDSDGPGDNTYRPGRPERRALLEKEREQRRLWQAEREAALLAQQAPLRDLLTRCQEALSCFRNRLNLSPDVSLPRVAATLISLGNAQWRLSHWEEALASYQEAVGHYRELAKQRPDLFLPSVDMTLEILGDAQAGLNRREEAEASYREAADLRLTLTQQ
jgi:tetratricopeptide (TPR) repeat protein